jgi:4-hydroxybenzoate polyprenyltransferase
MHSFSSPFLPNARAEAGSARLVYVALDRTLIRGDLLFENIADILRRSPLKLLLALFWLMRGKTYFRARIAETSRLNVRALPFRGNVVDLLKGLHDRGDRLVLATSAHGTAATAIAEHIGVFSDVLTDPDVRAIVAHADGIPFTYVGCDRADLAVWRASSSGIVVSAPGSVAAQARKLTHVEQELDEPVDRLRAMLKAMRPHQWLKNVLVFVPLLAAHLIGDVQELLRVTFAFVAFCLIASSIYLFNDLLDLSSDRAHPRKKQRPLASGALPISQGLLLAPLLLGTGLAIGALLGWEVLGVLAGYATLSTVYSAYLKTFVLIDVITLAMLYTVRIFAGGAAAEVELSFWILAFSMCLFFSLAMIKRVAELMTMAKLRREHAHGRDYSFGDIAIIQPMGLAAGFGAVLVFALYVNSDGVAAAYSHPRALWLLCVTMLYWIARMWVKTGRGEMDDDPLVYAARDRASLIILAVSAVIVLLAV